MGNQDQKTEKGVSISNEIDPPWRPFDHPNSQEVQLASNRDWRYAMASTTRLAVAKRRCKAGCKKSLYGDLLTVAAAMVPGHGRR